MNFIRKLVSVSLPAVIAGAAWASSPEFADSHISRVMLNANNGEIQVSRLVPEKGLHERVKAYATQMIADHTQSNQRIMSLSRSKNIVLKNSSISRQLEKDAKAMLAKLATLEGHAFDVAYMDGQIAMHSKVLRLIDTRLLPSSQDAALKTLLSNTRPVVAQHLQLAKDIRALLNKDDQTGSDQEDGDQDDGQAPAPTPEQPAPAPEQPTPAPGDGDDGGQQDDGQQDDQQDEDAGHDEGDQVQEEM